MFTSIVCERIFFLCDEAVVLHIPVDRKFQESDYFYNQIVYGYEESTITDDFVINWFLAN